MNLVHALSRLYNELDRLDTDGKDINGIIGYYQLYADTVPVLKELSDSYNDSNLNAILDTLPSFAYPEIFLTNKFIARKTWLSFRHSIAYNGYPVSWELHRSKPQILAILSNTVEYLLKNHKEESMLPGNQP